MPETDILNPTTSWDEQLRDCMSPDYGFSRKRSTAKLMVKAVGGRPWTRLADNAGHVFTFSWISRSHACVNRIKWYAEQYEDGYFTIIDHDGGGRHYVGRFTSDIEIVQKGNDCYDIQGATFEEMPTAPMVKYPSNWAHDAITFYPCNDFGDQMLATSGTWTKSTIQADRFTRTIFTDSGTAGDWAQYEYHGYGFQLGMVKGPTYGQAQIYLDGVLLTTVDCYSAVNVGAQIVYSYPKASLDFHRVKVVALGTQNALATAANIAWVYLQVMR